jgi:PAS domain S-box-containing protein
MMELDCAGASERIGAEPALRAVALLTDSVDDNKSVSYTEEDTAERWLPASEEKYRALFIHAADAIYLFYPKTKRLLDVNPAFLYLTGYTAADVQNLLIYEFITQDRDKIAAQVRHIVMSGAAARGEQVWRRKDGTLVTVHTAMSTIKQAGGSAVGFVIARDITERTRADEERDGLLKELETKNREMERFTCTVSHDLRSPLVTLQGFVTMLRADFEQNDREKAETYLEHIEKAVRKMDTLLSETLELSHIGRIVNPPEDVPFGDIVHDALEQTAGDLNIHTIEVAVAEDFPAVHVDRMRIVEVLVNLITNSIKYRGDQPQPKIEIGYRVDDKDTVFFVKDNGIGIDKSQYEKVFELFYWMDKGGEGTGAGLAIVKRIIEVHDGRIWIESEKGKGCTVCFTLRSRKDRG